VEVLTTALAVFRAGGMDQRVTAAGLREATESLHGRVHDQTVDGRVGHGDLGEPEGVAGVSPGRPDLVDAPRAAGHPVRRARSLAPGEPGGLEAGDAQLVH